MKRSRFFSFVRERSQKTVKNGPLPVKPRMLLPFTLLCAAVASWQSVYAATITATNTNDTGPGSLRKALAIAQDGDTIQFSVTGTIILTSGPLSVPESRAINISGPGANALVINGNATTFLFSLGRGTVSISDLALTNGKNNSSDGGAIRMFTGSKLTLTNCIISNNSTALNGGAIYVTGHNVCPAQLETNLTLNYCTVSDNSAAIHGGAISSTPMGSSCGRTIVTINNCTISGNSAGLQGGAFYNSPFGTLRFGLARLIVSNSTLSGNSAREGGAIRSYAGGRADPGASEVTVRNSTIIGNSARGLGDCISNGGRLARVTIGDTILKGRASGANIYNGGGTVTSLGYNLCSDNGAGYLTAVGDQINITNPIVGPLQDNGGPTLTHELLTGSPAIDHGNPGFSPPPDEDQRGCPFGRVFNNRIDVGSFESQPMSPPCPTPRPRPTPLPR